MPKKISQNSCNTALQKTLAYEMVFSYPYSYYQLNTNLISDKKFTKKQIDKEIKSFVRKGFIKNKEGKYFLPGAKVVDWNKRLGFSKSIYKSVETVFKILKKIPWIRMIAVTGSVASYNAETESDIDILIITQKNRLWISRACTWIILKLLKRGPTKEGEAMQFCTNLFVDESNMSWPKEKRNLYTAYSIISMQPMVDKKETYIRFLSENSWIKEYFVNFDFAPATNTYNFKNEENIIFNLLEKMAFLAQKNYMKNKITTEEISEKIIHFNKNDNSGRILKSYENILQNRKI